MLRLELAFHALRFILLPAFVPAALCLLNRCGLAGVLFYEIIRVTNGAR